MEAPYLLNKVSQSDIERQDELGRIKTKSSLEWICREEGEEKRICG